MKLDRVWPIVSEAQSMNTQSLNHSEIKNAIYCCSSRPPNLVSTSGRLFFTLPDAQKVFINVNFFHFPHLQVANLNVENFTSFLCNHVIITINS